MCCCCFFAFTRSAREEDNHSMPPTGRGYRRASHFFFLLGLSFISSSSSTSTTTTTTPSCFQYLPITRTSSTSYTTTTTMRAQGRGKKNDISFSHQEPLHIAVKYGMVYSVEVITLAFLPLLQILDPPLVLLSSNYVSRCDGDEKK